MEAANGVKERITLFLKEKGINHSRFGRMIGVSSSFVSSMNKSISNEKIMRIGEVFPDLNLEWLMTGRGEMLNVAAKGSIAYYPEVNCSMGDVQFLDQPDETSVKVFLPGFSDCDCAVNAWGDSMRPLIRSGEIVILKAWRENFIDWGHIYVIITKSGYRAIKRLQPSVAGDQYVRCVSENTRDNPPFDIERSEITRLYIVKGWIKREF